jgi:SAM-dependent methyltransferase
VRATLSPGRPLRRLHLTDSVEVEPLSDDPVGARLAACARAMRWPQASQSRAATELLQFLDRIPVMPKLSARKGRSSAREWCELRLRAVDTAARSLAHWSQESRAEMDAFYALARRDYERLARGFVNHSAWLRRVADGRQRITLLDVACGSGKFPEALQDFGGVGALSGELQIDYDLLDPSPFSLLEAARALRPPFVKAARHETLVEEFDDAVGPFDVVWATHALYSLTPDALRAATARMLAALTPGGALLIAQGSRDGHYLRFYRHFLGDLRDGQGTLYAASEDLAEVLRACGADPHMVRLS